MTCFGWMHGQMWPCRARARREGMPDHQASASACSSHMHRAFSGVAEVPSADDTLSIHFRLAGSGSGRGHIWAVGAPGGVSWASPWGACARFGAVCAGQSADASTLPLGSYLTPEDEQILPRVDTIHFLNSECQRHGERVLHARKLRGRGLPSLHTASTANSTTPTSDDQRDVSRRPQARPCANQSEPR